MTEAEARELEAGDVVYMGDTLQTGEIAHVRRVTPTGVVLLRHVFGPPCLVEWRFSTHWSDMKLVSKGRSWQDSEWFKQWLQLARATT